jgi:lysine 2,3-aminomutase
MEVHHLYVARLLAQRRWNDKHPTHLSRVLDIASHLRRTGSGRELPRYIISTELGEVDFGLTAEVVDSSRRGRTRLRLTAYTLDDYRALDPDFRLPEGVEVDDEGHTIVTVFGLTA